MVKNIIFYGNPLLRKKALWVKNIDRDIKDLIRDLKHTIKTEGGVGLAANQIGILKRVIVLHEIENEEEKIYPLINPEIIKKEGVQTDSEGCLSFPDLYIPITRSERVIVTYLDENNNLVEKEFSGLLARAIQHEVDHLDGILFIDRVNPDDEEVKDIIKKWKREFMLSKVVKSKVGGV